MAFSTNTNIYKISSHRCLNFSCFFLSFFFFFATFYFVIISNFTENFKNSTETALRGQPFASRPACLRVLSGSAPSPPPPRSLPSFLSLSHALRYALKCKTARSGCLYFAANDLNTAKPHGDPAGSAPLRQGRRWTRRPPCAAASPPPRAWLPRALLCHPPISDVPVPRPRLAFALVLQTTLASRGSLPASGHDVPSVPMTLKSSMSLKLLSLTHIIPLNSRPITRPATC